jgi:hypothetical protein
VVGLLAEVGGVELIGDAVCVGLQQVELGGQLVGRGALAAGLAADGETSGEG